MWGDLEPASRMDGSGQFHTLRAFTQAFFKSLPLLPFLSIRYPSPIINILYPAPIINNRYPSPIVSIRYPSLTQLPTLFGNDPFNSETIYCFYSRYHYGDVTCIHLHQYITSVISGFSQYLTEHQVSLVPFNYEQ